MKTPRHESKTKLLDATLKVVRSKGYAATRVEDVCAEAGVTKGSFFHHFKSKEDLALEAVAYWNEWTGGLFAEAPYHNHANPLDRVLAYIDFRRQILGGELYEFTCFAGTIIQEAHGTHPELVDACERNISGHALTLAPDIAEAIKTYGIRASWSAESLALHIQAVLQGGFILAKAKGGPDVAADNLDHLRRYIELLFGRDVQPQPRKPRSSVQ